MKRKGNTEKTNFNSTWSNYKSKTYGGVKQALTYFNSTWSNYKIIIAPKFVANHVISIPLGPIISIS